MKGIKVTVNGRALIRRLVCANAAQHDPEWEDVFAVKISAPVAGDDSDVPEVEQVEPGILVYPDGSAANRWEDGTAGISAEASELAEEAAADIDGAYCPFCHQTAEWRDFTFDGKPA